MTCCGKDPVWVENVPGKGYYYCRECKEEVIIPILEEPSYPTPFWGMSGALFPPTSSYPPAPLTNMPPQPVHIPSSGATHNWVSSISSANYVCQDCGMNDNQWFNAGHPPCPTPTKLVGLAAWLPPVTLKVTAGSSLPKNTNHNGVKFIHSWAQGSSTCGKCGCSSFYALHNGLCTVP